MRDNYDLNHQSQLVVKIFGSGYLDGIVRKSGLINLIKEPDMETSFFHENDSFRDTEKGENFKSIYGNGILIEHENGLEVFFVSIVSGLIASLLYDISKYIINELIIHKRPRETPAWLNNRFIINISITRQKAILQIGNIGIADTGILIAQIPDKDKLNNAVKEFLLYQQNSTLSEDRQNLFQELESDICYINIFFIKEILYYVEKDMMEIYSHNVKLEGINLDRIIVDISMIDPLNKNIDFIVRGLKLFYDYYISQEQENRFKLLNVISRLKQANEKLKPKLEVNRDPLILEDFKFDLNCILSDLNDLINSIESQTEDNSVDIYINILNNILQKFKRNDANPKIDKIIFDLKQNIISYSNHCSFSEQDVRTLKWCTRILANIEANVRYINKKKT